MFKIIKNLGILLFPLAFLGLIMFLVYESTKEEKNHIYMAEMITEFGHVKIDYEKKDDCLLITRKNNPMMGEPTPYLYCGKYILK